MLVLWIFLKRIMPFFLYILIQVYAFSCFLFFSSAFTCAFLGLSFVMVGILRCYSWQTMRPLYWSQISDILYYHLSCLPFVDFSSISERGSFFLVLHHYPLVDSFAYFYSFGRLRQFRLKWPTFQQLKQRFSNPHT